MFSKTSLSAIRALTFLARNPRGGVFTPRRIAESLGESPTYMAKVTRQLVKAGLLHGERGVKGGVVMRKPPDEITLLAIVEACQGPIVGSYCQSPCDPAVACGFHEAACELQQELERVLTRWHIGQLARKPAGKPAGQGSWPCLMDRPKSGSPQGSFEPVDLQGR